MVRNYYDLHVYNYYRYVQTAIQCWIFEDISKLNLWSQIGHAHKVRDAENNQPVTDEEADKQKKEEEFVRQTEAQIINILTKDIEVFVNGSWCFPYLLVVPLNVVVSAFILYSMYGAVIIICYVAMAALLAL